MVYYLARIVCRLLFFIVRRWNVYGKENVPATGGFVIVANHTSNWDPIIIGSAFDRMVGYMAKEELFHINPVITWLITSLKAFPIKRGQLDRTALRHSIDHLKNGGVIGLFPEGTRNLSGELQGARNGAAMLAIKAGVPVVPVGISGAHGWGKITVRIGQPVSSNQYWDKRLNQESLGEYSQLFMEEIRELIAEGG